MTTHTDSVHSSTSSVGTKTLGAIGLVGSVFLTLLGLLWTKPDTDLGETVRIMYVHVPSIVSAYVCVAICGFGSLWFLWKKSSFADTLAGAAGEVAMVLVGVTLITGMLWGRPTWGTYWVWDARLTSTALLFLLLVAYSNIRRMGGTRAERGVRSATIAVVSVVLVPVVHKSVEWWNTQHQKSTILAGAKGNVGGSQLFALFIGFVVFGVVSAWLVMHRFRVGYLEDQLFEIDADDAVAVRQQAAAQ